MTARVSFAHRARVPAVAVAWIAAFAGVGVGVSVLLNQLPLHPDARWWLAWTSLASVLGFGLATGVVGRWLEGR